MAAMISLGVARALMRSLMWSHASWRSPSGERRRLFAHPFENFLEAEFLRDGLAEFFRVFLAQPVGRGDGADAHMLHVRIEQSQARRRARRARAIGLAESNA